MRKSTIVALATVAVLGAGIVAVLMRDGKVEPTGNGGGGVVLTLTEMRYVIMTRFAPLRYCDPDSFPVAQEGGEERGARTWWATVDKTGEEVTAIRRHLGLVGGELTEPSVLRVYRDHKRLQAIPLEEDDGTFRFAVRTEADKRGEIATKGVISADGRIRITDQKRERSPGCPICLGGATLIDTPEGSIQVSDLRNGMKVWSVDATGTRIVATVVGTARRAVAAGHPMVRLTLADGRVVAASPGHPTREGRVFASLAVGDLVDGARIVSITVESSSEPYTYDLLPSGPTGAYWAGGVLVGSTLAVHLAA